MPIPSAARAKHLEKVIALVRKRSSRGAEIAAEFTGQLYRTVSAEDLLERRVEDLAGAALSLLEFAGERAPGRLSTRLLNPVASRDGFGSSHTVLQMANDDMPFLVDSMTMALNARGRIIHLTVHPIMPVVRDARGRMTDLLSLDAYRAAPGQARPESIMHVEFDREVRADELAAIEADVRKALGDVRAAVTDFQTMKGKCAEVIAGLAQPPTGLKPAEVAEGRRFLEWLNDDHFTFLGYREYALEHEKGEDVLRSIPGTGLGILREGGGKKANTVSKSFQVLPRNVRATARAKDLLIITKANSIATVHRPGYMDYIGVKVFDAKGEVVGERRFLGLFTSSAYQAEPTEVPLVQHKVEQVMLRSKLPAKSHGGKALLHILETFPRDELFQSSTEELGETALGVVALQERQRVKVFMRRDTFGRFFSCLVYVPLNRYSSEVRDRIRDILVQELRGTSAEVQLQTGESVLARLHVIVRVKPWEFEACDLRALEARIADAVRGWDDAFREALVAIHGEDKAAPLFSRFARVFPGAYRSDEAPRAAALDVEALAKVLDGEALAMRLFQPDATTPNLLRFKVFRREQPIPISDAVPMLEHLGLKVISERPYEIDLPDGSIVWIQDFEMVHSFGALDLEACRPLFTKAFQRVFERAAEDDGFNRLTLAACLNWRQVALLRAVCKYLLQIGLPFSQASMERALVDNLEITRTLVAMFMARHDPRLAPKARDARYQAAKAALKAALERVKSLDDDRILRAYRNVLKAVLRTNFFQGAPGARKPVMSFKLDPAKIPELPLPRPMFEIWVYSPRVEGVHLRFGKVARGGLRWSDRREDFRTEILGLVKAQQVKNTVIVPVGAKGGFFCKQQAPGADRDAVMKEGIACYQAFLRGLLDVTDNIVKDKIVPPRDTVRLDPDDPYLVVAADKGTATFSDIANGISAEYGHWLGDAFASGGSVGYDHKAMGITAKGGWESVKRHFREMGRDIQKEDFTVIGIGDMSGDVFGNGMLLSPHILLVAAFDHRHIFLDPAPDAARSSKERERMFRLPRSSWADYDARLISKGGGVFARSEKSITVSKEAAAVLGCEPGPRTPTELMNLILKAPVDLLWNGGIGTYVKAAAETNAEVGDRANDALRVNGAELRCKVIGEGGNLGMTQRGRVEYALNGGRLNTDFIDNSAGVDCSDHEVNIKILLGLAESLQGLALEKRNALLARMTDEVAELVLRDNYLQSLAISVAEAHAPQRMTEHVQLMRVLERDGKLNRALEALPTDEQAQERRKAGRGMTRPELAVLLSYAKMDVFDALLASDVPEDPYLAQELEAYFPGPLQQQFGKLMQRHRLKREIIATAVTNTMVNRMGSTFAMRMTEESGVSMAEVARAFTVAREVFDMRRTWDAIEALDNKVPARVQIEMMIALGRMLRMATHWFLERPQETRQIAKAVDTYAKGLAEYTENLRDLATPAELAAWKATYDGLRAAGVPDPIARKVAAADYLYAALDIVDAARALKQPVRAVADAWFRIGGALSLGWMRAQIERLPVDGHWQAVARGTLRDGLYAHQRRLAMAALKGAKARQSGEAVERWLAARAQKRAHLERMLGDMKAMGGLDFATASVALQEVSRLG